MERHGTVDFALTDDCATPDALADLFLSEPEPGTRPAAAARSGEDDRPRTAERPMIEGIMLGNLPVMGGAWVGQYAKHVADTTQMPAALLRVLGDEATLDLVLPRGQTTRLASRLGGSGVSGDLTSAVDAASNEAATWLVRLDEEQDADLLALPGLTRLTVLTGADDAAVVACYRTLKSMAGELARPNAPEVRLAIMGADSAKADAAEQRLRETAGKYLSRPVGPAVRIDKIGACSTEPLYRGRLSQPLDVLLKRAAQRTAVKPRATAAPSLSPLSFMAATGMRPTPAAKPTAATRTGGSPRLPALPGGLAAIGLSCPYAARLTLCADGAGRAAPGCITNRRGRDHAGPRRRGTAAGGELGGRACRFARGGFRRPAAAGARGRACAAPGDDRRAGRTALAGHGRAGAPGDTAARRLGDARTQLAVEPSSRGGHSPRSDVRRAPWLHRR